MSRQLTLDLSDEVYLDLLRQAEQAGLQVELLVGGWLARAVQPPQPTGRLRDWTGAFASAVPDAASRHRDYLGQAHLDGQPDE